MGCVPLVAERTNHEKQQWAWPLVKWMCWAREEWSVKCLSEVLKPLSGVFKQRANRFLQRSTSSCLSMFVFVYKGVFEFQRKSLQSVGNYPSFEVLWLFATLENIIALGKFLRLRTLRTYNIQRTHTFVYISNRNSCVFHKISFQLLLFCDARLYFIV